MRLIVRSDGFYKHDSTNVLRKVNLYSYMIYDVNHEDYSERCGLMHPNQTKEVGDAEGNVEGKEEA